MRVRTIIGGGLLLLAAGCGISDAERTRAERERARLELEEKARRDTEAANKAISDLNKKMFGQKRAEPAAPPPPPTDKP